MNINLQATLQCWSVFRPTSVPLYTFIPQTMKERKKTIDVYNLICN